MVSVLDGAVMASDLNCPFEQGPSVVDAVNEGAMLGLRPILITATVATLWLIPLLLASGIGSEAQKSLATIVSGGLITPTLLILVVLPVIYGWIAEWAEKRWGAPVGRGGQRAAGAEAARRTFASGLRR